MYEELRAEVSTFYPVEWVDGRAFGRGIYIKFGRISTKGPATIDCSLPRLARL